MAELLTERLLLRQWLDEDLQPFAELNADPERARRQIAAKGWGRGYPT